MVSAIDCTDRFYTGFGKGANSMYVVPCVGAFAIAGLLVFLTKNSNSTVLLTFITTTIDMSEPDEKKVASRSSGRIPRRKSSQGKRSSTAAFVAEAMVEEAGPEPNLDAQMEPVPEDPSNDAEGGPAPKKLKEATLVAPRNSYLIECVVEKLLGALNVLYFQNPPRNTPGQKTEVFEPFMPSFRSVFFDNVKDELLVDAMGARCDSKHQFIRNKKTVTDVNQMKYGWNLLLNESVEDPGDWAIHLCCCLNESQAYKNSFDTQRTSDRSPFFQVLGDITPEGGPTRKLDQVMMDNNIARYLCNKFNLKNYAVRRRMNTQEKWDELLQHYFQDTKRGRKVIEEYLNAQTAYG